MERNFTLKPHKSSRKDYCHHKTFLGIPTLPNELLFLSPILNQNDGSGLEDCTAFQGVSCRYNEKNNTEYDPLKQWQYELAFMGVQASNGTDLKTALATGVKTGFCKKSDADPSDNATAYFFVYKNGGMDLFDSIRTAIQQAQRPLSAGVIWMNEWDAAPGGVINNPGTNPLGGHAVKIAGWKQINGQPYLVVQNSWGTGYGDNGLYYFSRGTVNSAFGPYGLGYWSDDPNQKIKQLGWFQALCQNVIALLETLIAQKNGTYPPPGPHVSRIIPWAKAIAIQEGAKPEFNNPGNLKYTTLTASWGGEKGFPATDGGWICKFADYDTGFKALCNFLTLAAEDELLAFHHARTLRLFTKVYACPPNDNYAMAVAAALKVDVDSPISQLL